MAKRSGEVIGVEVERIEEWVNLFWVTLKSLFMRINFVADDIL
jgi:hypothetical protein